MAACRLGETQGVELSELFPAGGLGGTAHKILVCQELRQQRFGHAAPGCHFPVGVVPALEQVFHQRVDDHISGTSVECEDLAGAAPAGRRVTLAMPPMF